MKNEDNHHRYTVDDSITLRDAIMAIGIDPIEAEVYALDFEEILFPELDTLIAISLDEDGAPMLIFNHVLNRSILRGVILHGGIKNTNHVFMMKRLGGQPELYRYTPLHMKLLTW